MKIKYMKTIKTMSRQNLSVRCINPKNTGLKIDKVYQVTESENFKDCYILDVGWNWVLSKDMFELVGMDDAK